jgi:uncharacterized protein YuzE
MGKKLTYKYDSVLDEMNLYFGENKEAIGFNIDNDIFLQLDQDTDEVIGLTILNFKHRIIDKKEEIQLPVSGKFIANHGIFQHETGTNI